MTAEPPDWIRSQVAGRSKAEVAATIEVTAHGQPRRIVDVVCGGGCGDRLAMVTDTPESPSFTMWAPTMMFPMPEGGPPFWTEIDGVVPGPETSVTLHCFHHGHGVVTGEQLRDKIERYRSTGRRQRLVVDATRDAE